MFYKGEINNFKKKKEKYLAHLMVISMMAKHLKQGVRAERASG